MEVVGAPITRSLNRDNEKRQSYSISAGGGFNGRSSVDEIDRSIEAAIAAAASGPIAESASLPDNSDNPDEFTLILIAAVKQEPCLYDPNDEHYGNKNSSAQYRSVVWQNLCRQLNFKGSSQSLQAQWKRIRDRHVRERRRRKLDLSKADEPSQRAAARYFEAMRWIDEFINESGSVPSTSNGNQNSSYSPDDALIIPRFRKKLKMEPNDVNHDYSSQYLAVNLDQDTHSSQLVMPILTSPQNPSYMTKPEHHTDQPSSSNLFKSHVEHAQIICYPPNKSVSGAGISNISHFSQGSANKQTLVEDPGGNIHSQAFRQNSYLSCPQNGLSAGSSQSNYVHAPNLSLHSEKPLIDMIISHFNGLNDDEKAVTKINIQRIIMDARFGRGACLRMFKEEEQSELNANRRPD